MHNLSHFAAASARAIEQVGKDGFWPALHELIFQVAGHQMTSVFVYRQNEPPVRLYDSEGGAARDELHGILVKAGYLISPYYNGLIRTSAASGFYHIDAVAPDAFRQSKYFEVYYGRKEVEDEGMFLCPMNDGSTIVVMVERHKQKPRFDATALASLQDIHSLVQTLVQQHHERSRGSSTTQEASAFRLATISFGSEVLSRREREVAMLMLQGHSSKSAARELDISPETERVHRRRLYAKLGVTSHSEMFWLFLQAADYLEQSGQGDPLLAYLRHKRPDLLSEGS
ncbi:MAG: helix-turn-helix transcriptional regulator [Paracoccaceae bacterium]